ncbi:GIY-YIG nuclease family protein [Qipengyuania atrilutea]|uniref:GIY-YIG nuclease family protein n=1 Tax=Qipengyuania atrilutea TaxID=2744473 RepID=UPI001CED1BD6|nr:GIY-YIG nuclease family protein [Actirhodobacter atriluteus]
MRASKRNGTLYIGVASDLAKRIWEHREGRIDGFTRRYGCKMLVWLFVFDSMDGAMRCEKQVKEWQRIEAARH